MNIYNRCFDDQNQLRIRLESTAIEGIYALAERQMLTLAWSFVLDYENDLNPYEDRKEWVQLLSRLCTDTIIPSPEILKLAKQVTKVSKIRSRDALHLACAEHGRCDFFVTCDDIVVRRASRHRRSLGFRVRAINPVDFIRSEGRRYGET